MTKTKSATYIGLSIFAAFSGFLMTFYRYKNQELLIEKFSLMKTGNLICLVFFLGIVALSIINVFSRQQQDKKTISTIIISGLTGLGSLALAGFMVEKEYILAAYCVSLASWGFLGIGLTLVTFSRSKKFHILTSAWTFAFVAVMLFALNVSQIYFYRDDYSVYKNSSLKADAGIILGAAVWGGSRPSPVFRERINKGFELFESKIIPKLVLTGGGSQEELAEAEVARNELVKYGVPDKNLFIDATSTNTIAQILYVRDNLYTKLKWNKVIVISDNFHLFRAKQICSFNGISADVIATEMPLSTEKLINFCVKESVAVLFFWLFGIG